MIERFYYGRDKKSHAPIITICIMEEDGVIARGISMCNLDAGDQVSKEAGRNYARNYAKEALTLKTNNHPIHRAERKRVRSMALMSRKHRKQDIFFFFQSEYNPILTGFEANLLVLAQKVEEEK